jgi:hypothetical protein
VCDIMRILTHIDHIVQIDALNNALFYETMVYMGEDPHNMVACTQILFCISRDNSLHYLRSRTGKRASKRKHHKLCCAARMMLRAHDHYNCKAFKLLSGLGSASLILQAAMAARLKYTDSESFSLGYHRSQLVSE